MKKGFIAILALLLALAATACSSNTPLDTDGVDNPASGQNTETAENQKTEFAIGETWTVDGQWSLTVTSVTPTDDRNEFADTNPVAVYIVD